MTKKTREKRGITRMAEMLDNKFSLDKATLERQYPGLTMKIKKSGGVIEIGIPSKYVGQESEIKTFIIDSLWLISDSRSLKFSFKEI